MSGVVFLALDTARRKVVRPTILEKDLSLIRLPGAEIAGNTVTSAE